MTEVEGIVSTDFPREFIGEDPRLTHKVFGEEIVFGDSIKPDAERFPGWTIDPFTFSHDAADRDGCLFHLAPNSATSLGIVDPDAAEEPSFREWPLEGDATVLLKRPNGSVQIILISADGRRIIQYGPGTMVAYVAGSSGFIGGNIGKPAGLLENPVARGDEQTQDIWEAYDAITRKNEQETRS